MAAELAAAAEREHLGKDLLDAVLVALDLLHRPDGARLVLARRIADARRAAPHEDDRLVAGLLQPVEHHDLDQRADMQRRGRAVEADVAYGAAGRGERVQPGEVGALVDEAALVERRSEIPI